jgi:glycosyltransferase involved in cell wall biosynthesis
MDQMHENDLISIIVPSFNREHTILRALNSLINQTYANIEIIVVDDCSTDNTVPLIKSLMKTEPRLQLVINPENQGPNPTRNRGIAHATGKYLSFLDSDDEWYLETIEILWNKIKTTSDKVGVVYAGINFITDTYERKIYPKFRGNVFRDFMTKGAIGSYPLIKREVFTKTGLFDESEELRRGGNQEYELWIRIAQHYEFESVNEVLLKHYFHADSVTFQSAIKRPFTKINSYLYIWKKYQQYFTEDTDAYVFFCYKIFEMLKDKPQKKLAKKIIFMALKTDKSKLRTYYHLIFYLNNFYAPIDILSRVHDLASQFKEWYERFKFHFS